MPYFPLFIPVAVQIKHPVTGGDGYEPCAPLAPGAQECTLQYFADKGIADQVVPPVITMKDFEKVFERARPTVSVKDLEVGGGQLWLWQVVLEGLRILSDSRIQSPNPSAAAV